MHDFQLDYFSSNVAFHNVDHKHVITSFTGAPRKIMKRQCHIRPQPQNHGKLRCNKLDVIDK